MGDFDKKYVIKEAENILDELNKKDKEEKKQILKLKKDFRKVKRVNSRCNGNNSNNAYCIRDY